MSARSFVLSILLLAAFTSATGAADPPTAGDPNYRGPRIVPKRLASAGLTKRTWPVADLLGPIIEAGKAAPIPDPVDR